MVAPKRTTNRRSGKRGPGRPPRSSYGAGEAGPDVAQQDGMSRHRAVVDDWDRDEYGEEQLDQGAPLHASREQEHPSDEALHADEGDWTPPSLLEAPPPRPGFKQRWVRVTQPDGRPDAKNQSARFREGWRPRSPDNVPGGFDAPTQNHGTFGSCIMVEGMVLCEMPDRRHEQRSDFYTKKLASQTQAIDQQLLKTQQPGHPIDRTDRTRVTVGQRRRPNVQQDDDAA